MTTTVNPTAAANKTIVKKADKPAPTGIDAIRAKIRVIWDRMDSCMVERNEEIAALWLSLLCKQHCLLVGEPGTGKSMLCEAMLNATVGTSLFKYQVTAFTEPTELLGMWDIPSMQLGILRRHTEHTMVDAHFAFIDEFFRGNTAILNSFLSIMQERKIVIAKETYFCPLQQFVGAANHWPGADGDEERASQLAAVFDRFLVRRAVHTITSFTGRQKLCCTPREQLVPTFTDAERLTLDELAQAQAAVRTVGFSAKAFRAYFGLLEELSAQGIKAGNRREQLAVDLCRAQAWLNGDTEVEGKHFEPLKNVVWTDPSHIEKTDQLVLSAANPFKMKLRKYLDDLAVNCKALENPGITTAESIERASKVEQMKHELIAMAGDAKTRDQVSMYNGAVKQTDAMLKTIKERSYRIAAGLPVVPSAPAKK